jgi:hypothetical protein
MAAHVAALIMLSIHSELVALRLFYPQPRKQNQGILRLTDCYLTSVPFPGPQSLPETVSYAHTPGLSPGKLPSNSDQVLITLGATFHGGHPLNDLQSLISIPGLKPGVNETIVHEISDRVLSLQASNF